MKFVLQRVSKEKKIPALSSFKHWIKTTLNAIATEQQKKLILTIRIVDEAESAELNFRYRNKKYPTNVLSFNYSLGMKDEPSVRSKSEEFMGDILICAPVTINEAREQGKEVKAHFAHMTVHGVLHLLGYNHVKICDAEKMELIETLILKFLGFEDPYGSKKV